MQLVDIQDIRGELTLVSGLHLGAGNDEIRIGGVDNPVLKHPYSGEPYIPGSSIKGKVRSLLEWRAGLVGISEGRPVDARVLAADLSDVQREQALLIARAFGIAANAREQSLAEKIGPTRASFWDCALAGPWVKLRHDRSELFTEAKSENSINRISGVAQNPRWSERVPAGACFDFRLTLKRLDGDDDTVLDALLGGLKLLELEGLGGSGSRGYGKIKFTRLSLGEEDLLDRLAQHDPFAQQA
jgi:CRISPR-associated protein Csm3